MKTEKIKDLINNTLSPKQYNLLIDLVKRLDALGDERIVYAKMQDETHDVYAKIECEPLGSDGYDTAMFWDMEKNEPLKGHEEFRLYPLTIIDEKEDEVMIYDIWVNNTSYAYIHING